MYESNFSGRFVHVNLACEQAIDEIAIKANRSEDFIWFSF